MSEWIDVKRIVPNESGSYFARYGGYIFIGQYDKQSNRWRDPLSQSGLDQEVAYWMPIPPLPPREN